MALDFSIPNGSYPVKHLVTSMTSLICVAVVFSSLYSMVSHHEVTFCVTELQSVIYFKSPGVPDCKNKD